MTMLTHNLAAVAVVLTAADVIKRQGLARNHYYDRSCGKPPAESPVDVLGALAIACGLAPDVWEDDGTWDVAFRSALDAADLLVDALALDVDETYAETLGQWADERDAATLVAELCDAAMEVAHRG